MGALGRGGNKKRVWLAIKQPYAGREDAEFFLGKPPPNAQIVKGGPNSAYKSIQAITGLSPKKLKIDLGIMDILISKPKKKPGAPGAIAFKQDRGQRTVGDITISSTGRGNPRVTKGTTEESVSVNPIGSSKMPAEIAKQIGSVSAKLTSDGRVKLRVRRL